MGMHGLSVCAVPFIGLMIAAPEPLALMSTVAGLKAALIQRSDAHSQHGADQDVGIQHQPLTCHGAPCASA